MKNRGFTLVELLAVITILAIIAVITTPIITNLLSESKTTLNSRQIEYIENAAKNYSIKNISIINGLPSESYVTVSKLKTEGYLDNKSINGVDDNSKVCITWSNNQLNYEYGGDC